MSAYGDQGPDVIDAEVEIVSPPSRWRRVALAAAVLLVVAAVAVVGWWALFGQPAQIAIPSGTRPEIAPPAPGPAPSAEDAVARSAIAGLKDEVSALRRELASRPAASDTVPADVDRSALQAMAERSSAAVTQLGDRLSVLERRLAELVRIESALVSLDERVKAIETQPAAASAEPDATLRARLEPIERAVAALTEERSGNRRSAALAAAVYRLRQAAAGSGSFLSELDALERLGGGPPAAIAQLRPHAGTGVPSAVDLRGAFGAVARRVIQSTAPAGDVWWQATLARLKGLITIRRVGEVAGDEPDAIVARAEARLGRGDLVGALTEIGRLQEPAAAAVAAWQLDVERRVATNLALTEIEAAAVSGPAGPGPAR